jgi:hypothetical protein
MKIISTLILVLALSIAAFGQEYMTTLTYNISQPANDTKQFVENTSYLGISFDGRKFLLPWFSAGFYTGWQVFHDQSNNTLTLEDGTITGKQFRHINAFPIMLNAHIYLGGEQCWRPYFGINAGAYYTWKRLSIGVLTLEEKKWVWGFAPEAGFTIPIGDVHFNMSGKFNYAMPPSESEYTDDPSSLQYVSFHIGFAYYR